MNNKKIKRNHYKSKSIKYKISKLIHFGKIDKDNFNKDKEEKNK